MSIEQLRAALKGATAKRSRDEIHPDEDLLLVLQNHAEALIAVAVSAREFSIARAYLQAGGTPFDERLRRVAKAEAELLEALFRLEAAS